MKAYAILIKQNNDLDILFDHRFVRMIKKCNGAAVMNGYNQIKYVACLVFKNKADRDNLAAECRKLRIDYDIRNDAIIDDGYL